MLMWIILQVKERRSDVATRQGNGFFCCVVKTSGEKSCRTQQGECHSLCLCESISRREGKIIVSFVYKENYGDVASISLA